MIDVVSKRCIEPNCEKQPTYNIKGTTKRLYCFEHKKDGMIDVKNIRCIEPNCDTLPI